MDPANGTWSAGAIDRPIHDASCRFSRNQAGRRKPALRRAGRSRKRLSQPIFRPQGIAEEARWSTPRGRRRSRCGARRS